MRRKARTGEGEPVVNRGEVVGVGAEERKVVAARFGRQIAEEGLRLVERKPLQPHFKGAPLVKG